MSDVIRLLPDHIANQIAAGEVVQRPSSVVKELMENSIDAGATKIELHITDAGRTSIHIIDNGKGMSYLDARMAFERHATSKIAHADDLFALSTKGFRGEALASIAAIAHVTLKTRRKEDELGTVIQIDGSVIQRHDTEPCALGSSFEVKNLFFNVPARRNFLKSDQVEMKHIIDEFERVVLAHPDLNFKLFHNGMPVHNLETAPLRKRIVDIFGRNYNDKLVPIVEVTDIVKIEGFIGKPEASKKTRGEQFFFVNDRFFKDTYFNHAVASAFDQLLDAKHYPSYFLYLTIEPKAIDVNVHPTKTEIKFEEDKAIYAILKSAVRSSLGRFNITPTLDFERESSFDLSYENLQQIPKEPVIQVNPNYNPFDVGSSSGSSRTSGSSSARSAGASSTLNNFGFGSHTSTDSGDQKWENFWEKEELEEPQHETVVQQEFELEMASIQRPYILKNSLIIANHQSGLMIIHARRAQERLIYEQMMSGFMMNPLASQQLLFPLDKIFSTQEKRIWEENKTTLERIGFSWSFDEDTFLLNGMPAILDESTVISCIDKLLELFQIQEIDKGEVAHAVISQLAFAGSMSFKMPNDDEQIQGFVDQLFAYPEHTYSPSGKKIITFITNETILQLF